MTVSKRTVALKRAAGGTSAGYRWESSAPSRHIQTVSRAAVRKLARNIVVVGGAALREMESSFASMARRQYPVLSVSRTCSAERFTKRAREPFIYWTLLKR